MYWPSSLRNAQVLSQPFSGSRGSLSPRIYVRPTTIDVSGARLVGGGEKNRPGLALAQASSSCAVFGGFGTFFGLKMNTGPPLLTTDGMTEPPAFFRSALGASGESPKAHK